MSQQLKISSIFSAAALAALCLMAQLTGYESKQAPGIAINAPAPLIAAQIN